jgi:hypothetical protein
MQPRTSRRTNVAGRQLPSFYEIQSSCPSSSKLHAEALEYETCQHAAIEAAYNLLQTVNKI